MGVLVCTSRQPRSYRLALMGVLTRAQQTGTREAVVAELSDLVR